MRLIDADALKADYGMKDDCADCEKELRGNVKSCEYEHIYTKMDFCGWIDSMPTIEERKTGKWIERNPQNSDKCRLIECDRCGFSHIVGFNVPYEHWIENRNFCERCGADMREDKDENKNS